jgi:hypothetical protein
MVAHPAVAQSGEGKPFHIPGTQRVLDFSFKRWIDVTEKGGAGGRAGE